MLRSMKELQGYVIEATEGTIGTVDAFLFDDTTWIIRYLVVDLGRWLPGRRVLLVPATLEEPSWDTSQVSVDLSCEQVQGSPTYDPKTPVNRDYEGRLYDYYGRPAYWG